MASTGWRCHGGRTALAIGLLVAVAGCSSSATPVVNTTAPTSTTTAVTSTTALRTSVQPADLPIVRCRSSVYGVTPQTGTTATSMSVDLPTNESPKLAFYTDEKGVLPPVLAPRGWHCAAEVGADGSASIEIVPPNESISSNTRLSETDQAVTAQSPSACQDCIFGDLCPFYPQAVQVYQDDGSCPGTVPADEDVKFTEGSPVDILSTKSGAAVDDVISVTDPAHVAGNGYPSGGPYVATTVVHLLSYPPTDQDAQITAVDSETCVAAASVAALCKAIETNFVSQDWWITE